MDGSSFISAELISKLLRLLTKVIKSGADSRSKELIRINDVFGDCQELARFYIQPNCQQVNPADELEDETISNLRAGVFETINKFLQRDILIKDGSSQMFILADAGMGKTSLMMMLKLSHLMAFWPKGYGCELLKLGSSTLNDISMIENKSKTILLLDSLDEDDQCKQGGTIDRLTKILEETTNFYRVIITCRTQFFPETTHSAFNSLGKISFNNYDCPLIYLSLFTDDQVDAYLEKRYPSRLKFLFNKFNDPRKYDAKQAIKNINSLQFRPFLLSHVETLLESHRQGATEYDLYKGLVDAWLNREVIKLRSHHGKNIYKEDLLKACIWLAETMHRQNTNTVALKIIRQLCHVEYRTGLLSDSADRVIEGIDHIDIGTNSLLNRNSNGDFRFSHLSIREFLLVYGVELGILNDKDDPFNKTDKMLSFIKVVNQSNPGLFFNEKNGFLLTGFKLFNSSQLMDFDLRFASLEYSDLKKASLKMVNLECANLKGANLQGVNLQGVNLKGANLEGASLQNTNLKESNMHGVNLHGANLGGAVLYMANLNNANLIKANMEKTDLSKAKLVEAKLFESVLSGAIFCGANLGLADLKSSNLRDVNFDQANLTKADFRSADLTNANLSGANFTDAKMVNSELHGSNFSEDQRRSANFKSYENKKLSNPAVET